jgi:DNA-binding transcriptional ArsR family regulator
MRPRLRPRHHDGSVSGGANVGRRVPRGDRRSKRRRGHRGALPAPSLHSRSTLVPHCVLSAPRQTVTDHVDVGLRGGICTLTGTYPMRYVRAVDNVLLALSDQSRRTMLEELRRGPASVTELASIIPIARPGVSRHLRVLREAGLVSVRKDAQRRVYSIQPGPLAELDDWLSGYRAMWEQRLDALHTEVARGKNNRRSTQ